MRLKRQSWRRLQLTFSAKDKVLIDLEHKKELTKLLSAERNEELIVI